MTPKSLDTRIPVRLSFIDFYSSAKYNFVVVVPERLKTLAKLVTQQNQTKQQMRVNDRRTLEVSK